MFLQTLLVVSFVRYDSIACQFLFVSPQVLFLFIKLPLLEYQDRGHEFMMSLIIFKMLYT